MSSNESVEPVGEVGMWGDGGVRGIGDSAAWWSMVEGARSSVLVV